MSFFTTFFAVRAAAFNTPITPPLAILYLEPDYLRARWVLRTVRFLPAVTLRRRRRPATAGVSPDNGATGALTTGTVGFGFRRFRGFQSDQAIYFTTDINVEGDAQHIFGDPWQLE